MPYMKFLSVRPDVFRRLPSDFISRWTPLPLTMRFPLLGLTRDFHPLDNAHAKRTKHCRHKLKHRARPVGSRRISIPNRTSISERPTEVDGKRFGNFEMDTIVGRGDHGGIVTLIGRSTSMLCMRKLKKWKNAKELARTVIHLLSPFKEHVKSITTDNGTEFACHEMIGKSLGVTIYFTDPYASWQKWAIENANGLIRQYMSKTETFEHVSHQQITRYSKKINVRPRKKLEFKTPHECFYEQIK